MSLDDYNDLFNQAEQKYNLPTGLLRSQAEVESSGNPDAVGQPTEYGKAQGLMQILPSTAKKLGVDPSDPKQAIDGAGKLMKENIDRYKNVDDALMAYHGGTDKNNWGDATKSYKDNVLAQLPKNKEVASNIANDQQSDSLADALDNFSSNKSSNTDDNSSLADSLDQYKKKVVTPKIETKKIPDEPIDYTIKNPDGNVALGVPESIGQGVLSAVNNIPKLPAATIRLGTGAMGELESLATGEPAADIKNRLLNNPLQNALNNVPTLKQAGENIAAGVINPFMGNNLTAQDIAETQNQPQYSDVNLYKPQNGLEQNAANISDAGTNALIGTGGQKMLAAKLLGASQAANFVAPGSDLAQLGAGTAAGLAGKGIDAITDLGIKAAGVKPVERSIADIENAASAKGIDIPTEKLLGKDNLKGKTTPAQEEKFVSQINKKAADEIGANDNGQNHQTITKDAFLDAKDNLSKKYDAIHQAIGSVKLDNYIDNIADIIRDVDPTKQALFRGIGNDLLSRIDVNGEISAADIKSLMSYKSKLDNATSSSDTNVSTPAREIKDYLDKAVMDKATPEQKAEYSAINNKYKLMKEFEPIAKETPEGYNIKPEVVKKVINDAYSNINSKSFPAQYLSDTLNQFYPSNKFSNGVPTNKLSSSSLFTPANEIIASSAAGHPVIGGLIAAGQKLSGVVPKAVSKQIISRPTYRNKLLGK